jgi:hypothetical protein
LYNAFVRTSERRNTRADMDRNASDILAHHLAFAGVETGTDFNSKLPDFVADCASTTHAACRSVEGGENTVARALDLMTTETRKVALGSQVARRDELQPWEVKRYSRFVEGLLPRLEIVVHLRRIQDA